MGHFKRECPRLGSPTGEKRVSFQENKEALNSKEATREADLTRPSGPLESGGSSSISLLFSSPSDSSLENSYTEGRVKCEGENQGYESSSDKSVGEENNRDKRDTDESIEEEEKGVEDSLLFSSPSDSSLENSYP
jgi:hypothetical protein